MPGEIGIGFAMSRSLLRGNQWELFTIWGEHGNEILKVHRKPATLGELPKNPLLAGDPPNKRGWELCRLVEQTAKNEIDKAIDVLNED